MTKVYFYEAFAEEAEELQLYNTGNIPAGYTWKTIQEEGTSEPPAEIISLRTQSVIPDHWANKVSGILTRSTGYDYLQQYRRQAASPNLQCGYLPLYCNRSVAEQAMMLWMTLLRKLPRQLRQFADFDRDGLTGYECRGKNLLVVGVGNIGYEIVKLGRGLEMNVSGVDIEKKYKDVSYVPIEDGLPQADIIVCAMCVMADNLNYFNYKRLKQTRPGVVFINIARGELSDTADLLQLIEEQHLGGLGLDVYNAESELATSLRSGNPTDNIYSTATMKLRKFTNVILTPHNAFNTAEAVERKAQQSIQQLNHFLEHQVFLWPLP